MNAFRLSLALAAWLVSGFASAEAGWTDPGKIVAIEANIFGRILVQAEVSGNHSGCKEKQWFFREQISQGSANMYKLLLEAASNRVPVRLRVTGTCHLKGYSEISAAAMVP